MFSESNAMGWGLSPTDTVAITELLAVLITETVLSAEFVTYILSFAESNAISKDLSPTGIFAIKRLVAVLITETEELSGVQHSTPFQFTTYILSFFESNAIPLAIGSAVAIFAETE
uniref:Uncharacterized protein n=1 Tax=uncultured marine thaumarchaeote AD1000_72_F04 TaxID=1455938 RepID=A0A075FXN5_9ARCH|nr:hypothetical protein [uncultured marine thaumarchaeote AD1000_72_F04]